VETAATILVVTLDATSFFGSFASGASQLESISSQSSTNMAILIVCEPNFRCPVYTNNMCPKVSVVLLCSDIYFLDCTIDVWTQEALDLCAFLSSIFDKFFTSIAVPAACRNSMLKFASVTALMDSNQTQIANDNLVSIIILGI
jgi:hypothetical protein